MIDLKEIPIKLNEESLGKLEWCILFISRLSGISENDIWEGVKSILVKHQDTRQVDAILQDMHHRFGTGEMGENGEPVGYLNLDEELQQFYFKK